jgi:hypothetical protein
VRSVLVYTVAMLVFAVGLFWSIITIAELI